MSLKNKYFILILLFILLAINLSFCFSILELMYVFGKLLFTNYKFTVSQINFGLLEIFFEVIILTISITICFISKNRFFNSKLSWISVLITLLVTIFLLPAMITSESPDFYNNLNKTKLLSPFSSVQSVKTNSNPNPKSNEDKFIQLKNEIIPSSNSSVRYFPMNESGIKNSTRKIFILGTDEYGRDIFTRIIYGTRISFITGIFSVIVTLIIGLPLGFLAGMSGGIIDNILNRISEMFLSIPMIFLIILFVSFFGASLTALIVLLGFSGWMSLFKIVRGEILLIKKKDYFISSKKLGINSFSLLLHELIPVISVSVIINLVFQFGNVVLSEAALSYLGLSSGNSYPSWGGMIQEGQGYIYRAWWMILFPGIFLFVSLFVINSLGKKLNFLFNPRL